MLKKIFLIIFLAGVLIFSYSRSQKETSSGDFHVFWKSGVNLMEGQNLYQPKLGEREFLYPPFAAMFFIPFSILPFKAASFVFYFLNFCLWAASFFLIYKIFIIYYDDQRLIRYGLIFAFLTSFKLFWNNIMMVQCNEFIFFICLGGIFSFLKNKENWAIFFFALATGIKIWPVLFFIWLLINGSRLTFFKSLFSGLVVVLLPFLFGNGINNLENFFKVLSQISVQGKTEFTYGNQSLGATIFRLFTSYPPEIDKYVFTIWNLGFGTADMLFKISIFLILFLMIVGLFVGKKIGNKLSIFEPCIIFLAAHLISGKCFKAHLVTLSLVYMTVFMMTFSKKKNLIPNRWGKLLLFLALFLAFTGKEFIGEKAQFWVGGLGAWTWLMIFSFGYFLIAQTKKLTPNQVLT